ncbi:MAG: hypothetical protein J6M66_08815 [Lachnospiraceae bacterium]|nr:hypothetical protein [Lachnospiraceae bacterium]
MMSQLNQNSYATGIMNEQQLDQLSQALYSYCKVMRVPKLGPIPAVVTVLEGVAITLIAALGGVRLWGAVAIGALVSAVFAFLCWLAYRLRAGASKRFNSYLAVDGGRGMFSDFASAQPFANDQFRLGRYYLFIKNSAVLRLDSITDIVRVTSHYRMVPTGVYLSAIVEDENGRLSFPLCRVHLLKAGEEIDEIRKAVLQRNLSV